MIATLDDLGEDDLVRILSDPENALLKQYRKLLRLQGADLEFTPDAINEIARLAHERGAGARGLRAVVEQVVEDVMFEVGEADRGQVFVIDERVVRGEGVPGRRPIRLRAAAAVVGEATGDGVMRPAVTVSSRRAEATEARSGSGPGEPGGPIGSGEMNRYLGRCVEEFERVGGEIGYLPALLYSTLLILMTVVGSIAVMVLAALVLASSPLVLAIIGWPRSGPGRAERVTVGMKPVTSDPWFSE